MKLLHFADAHLDTQFAWAEPRVARRRRQAIREAVTRIARLAREKNVDAVLCAGDLFEHERVSPDTGVFLRALFGSLHAVPVFIAPGNHDWLGPTSLYSRIAWTPNVRIFEQSQLEPVELADGVTLWGAAHRAPANTEGFLAGFRVDRGGVNLAVFHGAESSFRLERDTAHRPHAAFRADELECAGLDFAFLGHYHAPRAADRYVYPGNPEPLTFGEREARGPVLATIDGKGRVSLERFDVSTTVVHDLRIDVTGCECSADVHARVATSLAGKQGYARVSLFGELETDMDLCAGDFSNAGPGLEVPPLVDVEAVSFSDNLDELASEPTVRGQFVRDVQAASDLTPEERRRVLLTGLRALDGRADLEIP